MTSAPTRTTGMRRLEKSVVADNMLEFIDQASFLGLRATGHGALTRCTWIYDRPINVDALRRFQHNLTKGLLGRRIERSPLPFGRHRWVSCPQPPAIDIAARAARGELSSWLDERARVPIDPEFGPSWHIGVLPLEDHGTAVSLVVSHSVADGLGLCQAIADAARGHCRDLGYPPPRSRTRFRATVVDIRETVRGMPETARALRAAVKLARQRRQEIAHPTTSPAGGTAIVECEQYPIAPAVTIHLDPVQWDNCAKGLGGTSNSLFSAFAAKLAERAGRLRNGTVTLAIPVGDRADGDTRANALAATALTVAVDPRLVTANLRTIRSDVKMGLMALQETPNELMQPLALTPLVSKRLARRLAGVALGSAHLPVGCSNLGELDPAVGCPDGTEADHVVVGLAEQGVTKNHLERSGGKLFLSSGRISGRIFVNVVAYLPGRRNTRNELREMVSRTLADFDLTGRLD